VNEQITNQTMERLFAAADQQQAIAVASVNLEVVLQQAQLAGRDLLLSRSPEQVAAIRASLRQIASAGDAQLARLEAQNASPEHQERFAKIRGHFATYAETLNEIGEKQTEILELFKKRDQTSSKWTRSVTTVLNSGSFGTLPNYKEVES